MSSRIRWLRNALLMLVVLAMVGALYQATANNLDAKRTPEPGQLFNAIGSKLKLNCTGNGSPAVILEAGLGDNIMEWNRVQPRIAKLTRVCSYDRAGYGGSEPGVMPRTSRQIAAELHGLLKNAGERSPFVLVGHSFGGYTVRLYNSVFPDQVAGIVLVDSTQEDQYGLLPSAWKQIDAQQLSRYKSQATWAPVFIELGVARVLLQLRAFRGFRRGIEGTTYLILQAKYLKARANELEFMEVSAEQARAASNFGDKPLIVLTAGNNSDEILRNDLSKRDYEEFNRIWRDDLQMRLVRLSTRGERILVPNSGHDIPSESPEAIVSAVEKVIRSLSVGQ